MYKKINVWVGKEEYVSCKNKQQVYEFLNGRLGLRNAASIIYQFLGYSISGDKLELVLDDIKFIVEVW